MQSIKGGMQVGGNLGAIAGGLSFPIGPQKSEPDEEAQFKEMFKTPGSWRQQMKEYQRNNPLQRQMPSAAIGNVGGMLLAQAAPGTAPVANAATLGGGMGISSEQMQMQSGPPIRFGVDIENEKVKNLRGSVNAQLDSNQSINFGGNYNVQDQSGQLGLGYQTPTFGFDVNLMRTPRVMNTAPGYGVQGNVTGRF